MDGKRLKGLEDMWGDDNKDRYLLQETGEGSCLGDRYFIFDLWNKAGVIIETRSSPVKSSDGCSLQASELATPTILS